MKSRVHILIVFQYIILHKEKGTKVAFLFKKIVAIYCLLGFRWKSNVEYLRWRHSSLICSRYFVPVALLHPSLQGSQGVDLRCKLSHLLSGVFLDQENSGTEIET